MSNINTITQTTDQNNPIGTNELDEYSKKLADAANSVSQRASNFADSLNNIGKTVTTTADVYGSTTLYSTTSEEGYTKQGTADKEGMANQVIETGKSLVRESEAVQGYERLKDVGRIVGIGSNSAGSITGGRVTLSNALYNSGRYNDINFTGNVRKDYALAVSEVDKALQKSKIDSNVLSKHDIEKALKKGKIGNKTLTSNDVTFLQKKLELMKLQGAANAANSPGRIRAIGKTWMNEGLEDSDVQSGYNATKSVINVGRATVSFGKALKVGGLNSISGGISIGDRAIARYRQYANKKRINAIERKSTLTDADKNRIQVLNNRNKVISDNSVARENSRIAFKEANKKGFIRTGANKLTNKIVDKSKTLKAAKDRVDSFRLFKKAAKERFASNKVVKFFTAPFRALTAIKVWIKAIIIKIALIFLAIIVFYVILCVAIVAFNDAFDMGSDGHSTDNSNAQVAIDRMFECQYAFENNIWKYTKNSTETQNFGVFNQGYKDEIKLANNVVNNVRIWDLATADHSAENHSGTNVAYYEPELIKNVEYTKNNDIVGYNLYNYFGSDIFDYYDRFYLIKYDEYGNEYESDEYEEIHIYGEAGLFGDIGYISSDGTVTEEHITDAEYAPLFSARESYFEDDLSRVSAESFYSGSVRTDYEKYSSYINEQIYIAEKGRESYKYGSVDSGRELFSATNAQQGEEDAYGIDHLYKAIISAAYGILENAPNVEKDEYDEYINRLFYSMMGQTDFEIEVTYESDPSQKLTGIFVTSDGREHDLEFDMIRPTIKLIIKHQKSGMYDIASISDLLSLHDSFSELKNSDTFNGWFSHSNKERLARNLDMAMFQYELSDDDWKELYDCFLPKDFLEQHLSPEEIETLINELILQNGGIDDKLLQMIQNGLDLIGTRYQLGGKTSPFSGLDCSGFINMIAKQAGVWSGDKAINSIANSGRYVNSINFDNLAVGTIITKKYYETTLPNGKKDIDYGHIGIYIGKNANGDPLVLECCSGYGVIVNNLNESGGTNFKNYHYITDINDAINAP